VYISLPRDEDGYPPYEVEELHAEPLGGSRHRILGIPVFAYGLAVGDVVRVARVLGDRRLWVTEVAEPGDHWTARVLPRDTAQLEPVAAQFRALGCAAWATPFRLVAVDVPPQVGAELALKTLQAGFGARRWDFDLGVVPPA
jgi:hypothetical protein